MRPSPIEQVEQLKNVVQSLSHASAQDGAQASAEKYSETAGMIDLDPLLGGVPGVDPHMLLLLHRSPWADGVIEGIRKEETCFEWQGRDRWGSKNVRVMFVRLLACRMLFCWLDTHLSHLLTPFFVRFILVGVFSSRYVCMHNKFSGIWHAARGHF